MSIKNLFESNNKAWLVGNFNNFEANTVNVTAIDSVTFDGLAEIEINSSTGASGQHIEKDGSNNLSWANSSNYGKDMVNYSFVSTPLSTVSASYVIEPNGLNITTWTIGDEYIMYFSCEVQNIGGTSVEAKIDDQFSNVLAEWSINDMSEYTTISGMVKVIPTAPTEAFHYWFKATGGGTSYIKNLRFFGYKI